MIKTLLKSKLYSLLLIFFYNSKTKKRSSVGVIFLKVLLALFLVFSAGMLGVFIAVNLCKPLCLAGLGWLYFALVAAISSTLGLITSIFMTYSSLYLAKDNDLLLSMPIRPRQILFVRMAGCYLMTLLFEAVLYVPAILMYFLEIGFSAFVLVMSVIGVFILPLFSLALSCLFAWLIALIMPHVKQKTLVRTVISLLFLTAYYIIYFNATNLFRSMITNSDKVGNAVELFLYPIALFGKGLAGDITKYVISLLMFLLVFLVVYYVLTVNFFRLATAKSGVSAGHFNRKSLRVSDIDSALLKREFLHFKGSAAYMLNCGLGIIMMIAAAAVAFIKGNDIIAAAKVAGVGSDLISMLIVALLCLIATMSNITAPSISIEGNGIYLLMSLPVAPWRIIKSKIKMHLILTVPPTLFASLSLGIVFKVSGVFMLMIPVSALAFVLMYALAGIALNLLNPNVHFPNETAAIKQNVTSLITMFGSFAVIAASGVIYYFLDGKVAPGLFLVIFACVMLVLSFFIYRWLRVKGEKRFSTII